MTVYDFTVKTSGGKDIALSEYRGKVLLIVNTASKCGFTPQYDGLEKLYKKYKAEGLEILGFPSNDFAQQEPGSDEEIHSFCSLNYGVSFPILSKVSVRGKDAHPLFNYLTSRKAFKGFDPAHPITAKLEQILKGSFPEILEGDGVKWNFTKFLIDRNGEVVTRFEPTAEPEAIAKDIADLLAK